MRVVNFVLLGALLAGPSAAGMNSWTSAGPTGGDVFSLAVDPSNPATIYAGTLAGIFKSTDGDGGAGWAVSSAGLPTRGRPAASLAISSMDPSTVYAGTISAGAYKSTDAGSTWAAVNADLPDHAYIQTLAVDPSSSTTVYAGGPGLFKSTDGGASWSQLSGGLPSGPAIRSFAIDPSTPDTLYVGTGGGTGSFKSTDGGLTWAALGGGLGDCLVDLAVNASLPSTIYAAGGCGFARSTDGGASWSSTLTAELSSLAIDPSNASTVLVAGFFGAGIFRSTDAGETWDSLGMPEHYIRALAVAPAPVGAFLLGSYGCGVLESLDAGRTWVPSNAGLINTYVNAIAVDPEEPRTLYAGMRSAGYDPCGGVSKSTDGGLSWSAGNFSALPVYSLAIDPAAHQTIYAGTAGVVNLLKSTDGGRSWQRPRPGYFGLLTSALVIDPKETGTIYAVVGDYLTTQHVFKSTDGGNNWQRSEGGLPFRQYFQVFDLAVSASKLFASRALFAATSSGVFRSLDGGTSWQLSSAGIPSRWFVSSLAISPNDPRVLYAGVGFSGVYRSTDAGDSWAPANRGFPEIAWVQGLVVDPVSPATVYAGTFGVIDNADSSIIGKVYVTSNGGLSWAEMNTGMPETSINKLAIDSRGMALHAATEGNGIRDFSLPPPAR